MSMQADEFTTQVRANTRRIVRHIYVAILVQTAVLLGIGYWLVMQIANG